MSQISVIKRDDKFIAVFRWSTETKNHVKATGFKFDSARKEWWTSDEEVAARVSANGHATPVESPPIAIPAPDGLEYLPYQLTGIRELMKRKHALLADEMGLGKTIQVIGAINSIPEINRALIICPASLKLNWKNELLRWSCRPFSINVISPGSEWLPCDIVIINYEQVAKYRGAIDDVDWDLLVCDESHYLKGAKSKRTQAIVGRWDDIQSKRLYPIRATHKWWLTGTPILNRPKELWTTVRALDRNALGDDWLSYHTRYCDGYQDLHGWQIDGASHLGELQDKLRSSIMIRRRKEDVLTELPAKRRQLVLLPADTLTLQQILREENLAVIESESKLNRLRDEVEALSVNQADSAYKKAVEALEKHESVTFNATAIVRHRTALAKLHASMDHLINVLANEQKIVVFAWHHDVIDGLMEGLAEYGVVKIDGRDKLEDRQQAVTAFQADPKIRIIIGSITAMGVGLTLTAASYVAFVELDWVPGNMAQAEDRLHRIGQVNSVLVQHLMLDGSFDGRMANSVIRKMNVIKRTLG